MTAVRKGNNWVLNGTKTFCTNGHYADVLVVIAVTDRAAHTHGLSAFVVENLDLTGLAADGVRRFALILTHPKLRGATGAWTSPIALT